MNGLEKLIEINIIAAHAEKIRQANRAAAQANYYGPEANRLAVGLEIAKRAARANVAVTWLGLGLTAAARKWEGEQIDARTDWVPTLALRAILDRGQCKL